MGSPQNYYGVGFFEGATAGPTSTVARARRTRSGHRSPRRAFWGAIFTPGGVRENGDALRPAIPRQRPPGAKGGPNPDYDADGYDYTIEVGCATAQVRLFDPDLLRRPAGNGHGGWYGAGDHWTDRGTEPGHRPVAVTYRLYDTNGTRLHSGR